MGGLLPKQEAENAVGAPSEASAIAATSKLLLDGWRERRRAVTLVWPYGGASVEVAGDVLGGWHCRAHLNCTAQGCSVEIRVRRHARLPLTSPASFAQGLLRR